MDSNQSREEVHGAEFRKVSNAEFPVLLPMESGPRYLPASMSDKMHGILPTREARRALCPGSLSELGLVKLVSHPHG